MNNLAGFVWVDGASYAKQDANNNRSVHDPCSTVNRNYCSVQLLCWPSEGLTNVPVGRRDHGRSVGSLPCLRDPSGKELVNGRDGNHGRNVQVSSPIPDGRKYL